MKSQDINLKLFIPSIAVIIIAIVLIFSHSTTLVIDSVGFVLSFSWELAYVFWVIVVTCCISYYISLRKTNIEGKELLIHLLGPIPDMIFSVITYGMIFQTAIIMLNGIFKQYFYGYEFIRDIGYADLFIIAVPMVCLLFWSVIQAYKLGAVAYTYSGRTAKIRIAKDKFEDKNTTREHSTVKGG